MISRTFTIIWVISQSDTRMSFHDLVYSVSFLNPHRRLYNFKFNEIKPGTALLAVRRAENIGNETFNNEIPLKWRFNSHWWAHCAHRENKRIHFRVTLPYAKCSIRTQRIKILTLTACGSLYNFHKTKYWNSLYSLIGTLWNILKGDLKFWTPTGLKIF